MKIDVSIGAGKTLDYHEPGDFFRLMESSSPVNVTFYKQGKEVSEADNIGEGYAEKFRVGDFDLIRIYSATAQNLQFVTRYGADVYYDKPPTGTVTIEGNNGAFTLQPHTVSNSTMSLFAANATRKYLFIQNNDPVSVFNIRVDGAAASISGLKLRPGESVEWVGFVPTGAITIQGSVAAAGFNVFGMWA